MYLEDKSNNQRSDQFSSYYLLSFERKLVGRYGKRIEPKSWIEGKNIRPIYRY